MILDDSNTRANELYEEIASSLFRSNWIELPKKRKPYILEIIKQSLAEAYKKGYQDALDNENIK